MAVEEGAVGAPEIAQEELLTALFDREVTTRERRVVDVDLPTPTADRRRRTGNVQPLAAMGPSALDQIRLEPPLFR